MLLRAYLLASTSVLIPSLGPGALAQTPAETPVQPPAQAPAAAPSEQSAPAQSPQPTPAAQAPTATSAPAPNTTAPNAKPLPTIQVTAARRPKPSVKPKLQPAPPPPPPTTYETGAPSVGGGPAVPPTMASQMTVSGEDLNARPMTHTGELLEAAPGLMVIEHADAGKANQYYLRGWNLDHGTDLATFWDDIPVNLPTHAHGQGYTDLNWLIPETVSGLEVRKGPYWADVGDFENSGNLHISVLDSVPRNIESVTVGSFGYERYLALGSTKAGAGTLLYAAEFNSYDAPWTTSDDMKKFSGLLRYSQGTATDGFSLTALAYTNTWNMTEQNALRGYTTGQIGLYGELDPTDGGDTSRFSLSARLAQTTDNGSWKANAYAVKYTMNLFNDFTWYLDDPVNGDQFHQHDDRVYGGGGASRTFEGTFGDLPTETVIGVQGRDDDINIQLNNTVQRQFLSNTLVDHVNEGNAAIYAQNTLHWTPWLQTVVGWRGDYYAATVNSMLQPANSGSPKEAIGSPKFRMVIGPFAKTELFVGAGMGYHSNDARGTVTTEVPGDPTTAQGATPFLVRSRGAEVGLRTKAIPNLDSSVSLFYIHQDSELFFDGDEGTTTPGLPSQRTGIEFTNDYRPASWVHVDANLALSRARFLGFDTTQEALYQSLAGYPQEQIGNAPGNFVYNAPWMIGSAGITLGEKTGWFSSLRWRYISQRPLTEDGVFQSPAMNLINGSIGYRFDSGWRIQLDALNLLDSATDQVTYAYGGLLTTDALFAKCYPTPTIPAAVCSNGVMDYSYHPIEPLAFRLTLAGPLETIGTLKPSAMLTEMENAAPFYALHAENYDWTGFFLGAHAEVAWSKTTGATTNTATGAPYGTADTSSSDWHGGVQVGYDYMMPNRVVLGIEADVSSGESKITNITDTSGTSANQIREFDAESVRGRLGYAFDNVLVYGTGGLAWSSDQFIRTQLTGQLNLATAGTEEAVNKYLGGWTAGGGAAVALAENWNVFGEYRHTEYGATTLALPFSQLTTLSKTSANSIDLGVNYKFDWNRPAPQVPHLALSLPKVSSPFAPPSAAHPYNWTGIYIGADGGYGWHVANGILTTAAGAPLAPYDYNVHGPIAGVFAGANYQVGQFVAGVEGDWQRSSLTGNNQYLAALGAAGAFPGGPFYISTTIKDYESVRGRFGIASGPFLLFGTGGFAWGDPSNSYAVLGSAPFVTNGGNFAGWTAGAGLDYGLTENIFGRIEYRYTDLKMSGFVSAVTDSADAANKMQINDFRVGLGYKFGGS